MSASEDEQGNTVDTIRWRSDDEGIELKVVHDSEKERTLFFDPEVFAWIEADDDWVMEVPQ